MRVLVLGGGALGMAAAVHLVRSGHAVEVVERGAVASGTTGRGAGLLSLGVREAMDRRLVAWSLAALGSATPVQDDAAGALHRPGSHHVAGDGKAGRALEEIAADLARLDLPHTLFDPAAWAATMRARGAEPELRGVRRVLSIPADAWADARAMVDGWAKAARSDGVRFLEDRSAAGLVRSAHGAVRGVRLVDGSVRAADRVVVALGVWSRGFLSGSGLRLPTVGYRTHAVQLTTPLADAMPILHDTVHGYYLRPDGPGRLLVGDGTVLEPTDPDGFTEDPEPGVPEGVVARAVARWPGLGGVVPGRAWRGLLTAVPDRRPLVGAHPDAEGVVVAAGGNGFGFMRAWALGACAAGVVDGGIVPQGLPPDALAWMDPARLWPDPPEVFTPREGFTLTD